MGEVISYTKEKLDDFMAQAVVDGQVIGETMKLIRGDDSIFELVIPGSSPVSVQLSQFGIIADGVVDDTLAIQAAIDAYAVVRNGVRFVLPDRGTLRTTAPLVIKAENTEFVGSGSRNPQVPLALRDNTVKSTIYSDHAGACFNLSHIRNINGFRTRDLTLHGASAHKATSSAFGFDLGGNGAFRRDFIIERTTVTNFHTAFLLYASSATSGTSANSMGVLRVSRCNVMHNTWIARTLNGAQWNGFVYTDNDSGQNGYLVSQGGISISAHAVWITGNVLEGQRNVIQIYGAYRSLVIKGNYFEACVGDYCINIVQAMGPVDIGPNFYLVNTTTHRVKIEYTGAGQVLDAYFPSFAYHMPFPELGSNPGSNDQRMLDNSAVSHRFAFADRMNGRYLAVPPRFKARNRSVSGLNAAQKHPVDPRLNIPVRRYTTTGSGINTITTPIVASIGDWLVLNILMLRQDASNLAPYWSVRVNDVGAPTGGSVDMPFSLLGRYMTQGEWELLTCAVKTTVAVTSIMSYFYPYGINPPAGLIADWLNPEIFVVNNINDIRPAISERTLSELGAAPAFGTWANGDEIHRSPQAVGQPHKYVCTAAGTPGTWSSMGVLT